MRLVPAFFATLLVAVGCSSGSSSSPSGGTGTSGSSSQEPAGAKWQTVEFKMNETVTAGQEVFMCQYVKLPAVTGWMVNGTHDYTAGSHHLLLYTTDLTSIPAGGDVPQDCYEGSGSFMSHVRGVLYGAQTPTGGEQFPDGVGLATTPNEVLLFQVHYINATASSLKANVDLKITLDTGSDIVHNAGVLFLYDPFIDVPPGAKAQAQMRAPIPQDITLLFASSHYHARGVGYAAYVDTPGGMATKPFYTSASWSSPQIATMSMPIKAGSKLRFECDYDNSAGTQEYFQGPSAATNEMCMFVGAYWPDMGEIANYGYANPGPDMFGTAASGTKCNDTLTCIQNCPASSGTGGSGPVDASPCMQKCMVNSCSSASTPLFPLLECINGSCSNQCASTTSSDCSTCVAANCATQYSACMAHTCN